MMHDRQPEKSNLDEQINQLKSAHQNKSSPMSQENSNTDPTDELLEAVKSQFKQQSDSTEDNDLVDEVKSQFRQNSQDNAAESSLSELKSQFQNASPPSQESEEDSLAEIKSRYQQQKQGASAQKSDSRTDELLDALKTQHHRQKKEHNEEDYKRHREEIIKAEQQKQKKRKYLTQKAQTWLENLDPYSDEGFWFEEFAESYSSRLEAAVDYLAVFEEN